MEYICDTLCTAIDIVGDQTGIHVCVTEDYDGALGVFTEMAYLAQESGGKCLTRGRIEVSYKK